MKLILLGLIFSATAYAAPAITSYSCRIALFAEDLKEGSAEETITRPMTAAGAHGGDPHEFYAGPHQISVVADAKWRGIKWARWGKTVAHVMIANSDSVTGRQVTILSNPENPAEVVQLICDPLPGEFPKE